MIGRGGDFRAVVSVCLLIFCGAVHAQQAGDAVGKPSRAHINYMLQCQGCHMPNGIGAKGAVPRLQDFVGYFLHDQDGREFIVRVPGVAFAPLGDQELTELLNWMVTTYSADQLPDQFVPYTVQEITRLRKQPEIDPLFKRVAILDKLSLKNPALAKQLANGDYAH